MSDNKRPAELVWECAQGIMYKEAYSVLGNRTDSEDAVMDAMVRIVKNEKKFFLLNVTICALLRL